jgi:polyketide synthase 12/myxalamid-type polyketide synthase MxaB
VGGAGPGTRAAANASLDAFAQWRRSLGLACTSVNWGAWSDIGAAARLGVAARAGAKGIGTIAPAEGFAALGRLMNEQRVQTTVAAIDWPLFLRHTGDRLPRFLSRIATSAAPAASAPVQGNTTGSLIDLLAEGAPGARLKLLVNHVRERAAHVLAAPVETLHPQRPLNEQGLDSLMAVELRNVLSTSIQRPLSATLLFDYPTVEAVGAHLASLLGFGPVPGAEPAPSQESASNDLLDHIDELSDEEIDRLLAERMAAKG